jgi:co-chaperonin GroES (HSP10)
MESRLLNSQSFEFRKLPWDSVNRAGCVPIEAYILVLVDEAVDRSTGGIYLTPDILEKRQMAAETGTIIAVGDGAFYWNAERSREYRGRKPQPGDHVLFARYAGRIVTGNDGRQYRIMLDREVGAIATDGGFSVSVADQTQ